MDILRKEKRFSGFKEVPEQTYTNKELHYLEFCQILDMLPKESRIIFLLYYGERFTTREIAEVMEINENTVKARLRRGRKLLETYEIVRIKEKEKAGKQKENSEIQNGEISRKINSEKRRRKAEKYSGGQVLLRRQCLL